MHKNVRVINSPEQLKPNVKGAFITNTFADASVFNVQSSVTLHADTTHVELICEGDDLRYRLDGQDPAQTASGGTLLIQNTKETWHRDKFMAARFIREAAVSATLNANQLSE